jgi:hypothetical protein
MSLFDEGVESSNRLVLVGPMTGYPEYNVPLFNEVERRLKRAGYAVWSPVSLHDIQPPGTVEAVWYLKHTFTQINWCNGIALVTMDIPHTSDAQKELKLAEWLKIPVWHYTYWLDKAREEA